MWTRKSASVAGGSALALLAGLYLANPALGALGLVGGTWLALAYLQSRSLHVAAARRVELERCREGDTFDVEVTLTNEGRSAGFLVAADTLPRATRLAAGSNVTFARLEAGASDTLRFQVEAPIRGHLVLGPVKLRLMDVFGLFHEDVEVEATDHVTVYPRAEEVGSVPGRARYPRVFMGLHRVHQPGQGMEFFGLREYVYGDPLRQVNWKASAKTGKTDELIVNQRQRESMSDVTVLVDARAVSAAGEEHLWPLTKNARAAATLLALFAGQRDRVRLAVYGDGTRVLGPGAGERHRLQVLDALAGLEPAGDAPLAHLVDEILPNLLPKSPIFLLSSLADDPTILSAVERLLALENSVTVISPRPPFPASEVDPDGPPDGAEGATPEEDAGLAIALAEREARLNALRGYGATVIDWEPDEPLTVALAREVMPA